MRAAVGERQGRVSSAALGVVLVVLTACSSGDGERLAPVAVVEADRANFVLEVSNHSREIQSVPISVSVDGHQVVAQDFHVENQHTFVSLPLRLSPGKRTLVAQAGDGTMHKAAVMVPENGRRWGVLTYWASSGDYEPHFNWSFLTEPPLFG